MDRVCFRLQVQRETDLWRDANTVKTIVVDEFLRWLLFVAYLLIVKVRLLQDIKKIRIKKSERHQK